MQPISSISLTSMMDITFTLLIAFMIVAPSLKHGLKLDLPEAGGGVLNPPKPLVIAIRKSPHKGEEERIYVNEKRVSIDNLGEKITALYERRPGQDVLIEADKSVPYEIVARVLHIIQKSGIDGVGLVTEPESG
jgi:biopolymer transport protein TolR